MYYIINAFEQYYAGKCCSDNKTPVWKNHWTRAIGFTYIEEALDFAKSGDIFWLSVKFIREYKKEDIVPKKESITLHHSSMGVTVTHEIELSDYNSMIQGYINFLRGIGMVIPEEEDRV